MQPGAVIGILPAKAKTANLSKKYRKKFGRTIKSI